MGRLGRIAGAAGCLLLLMQPGHGQGVVEPHLEYSFARQTGNGVSCQIVVTMMNMNSVPNPNVHEMEAVNLRASIIADTNTILHGFSADVADTMAVATTGKAQLLRPLPISSAKLWNSTFDSTAKLRPLDMGDGGFVAVSNAFDGGFINMVAAGGYFLAFKRLDISDVHTYAIRTAPPADVMRQMRACVDTLIKSEGRQ